MGQHTDFYQLPDHRFSTTQSLKLKLELGLSHSDYQTLRKQTSDLLQPLQELIDEFKLYEDLYRRQCQVSTNQEGCIDGIYFTPQSVFERHVSDNQNLVDIIKCTKIWAEHIANQEPKKKQYREQFQREKERLVTLRENMKRVERRRLIERKKNGDDPLTLEESSQIDSELSRLFPDPPSTKNSQQQFYTDLDDMDYVGASNCLKVEYDHTEHCLHMTTLCRFSGDGHIFVGKSGAEYVMLMGFPASKRSQCVDNYEIIGQFKIEDKKEFIRRALHYVDEYVNKFQNKVIDTTFHVLAGDLRPELVLEISDNESIEVKIRVHCVLSCDMKGYEQMLNQQLKQLKQYNPWDDAKARDRKREFDDGTVTTVEILNDPESNPFNWRVIEEEDLFHKIVTFPDRPPDTMHKQNHLSSHFVIIILGIASRRGVKLKSVIINYLYWSSSQSKKFEGASCQIGWTTVMEDSTI